jgi:hypothetical protein
MEIEVRENHQRDSETICKDVIIHDDKDNRYKLSIDKFGGIDIIALDGSLSIEPHVSNNVTIKTI